MTPHFKKVHLKFKLNGHYYSFTDLMDVAYNYVKEGAPYQQEVGNFLLDWLDGKDYVTVKTSGSTGNPKHIKIKKQAMVNSAIMTGDFLNLTPGDSALHCLPSNYIAGKMMLIRAIILGLELELVKPAAFPYIDGERKYDFCAMTPMQLKNVVNHAHNIKTIIIGGSRVPESLILDIQKIDSKVYETFGMTETITHIALRKLNNLGKKDLKSSCFKVLPDVKISQDARDCLIINAPKLLEKTIVTNDIVKMQSNDGFEWLGRYDNVINSGGIKLYPEVIEAKLRSNIKEQFFIAGIPDETLGEKVVLVLESETNTLDPSVFKGLDKYEIPKEVFNIDKFAETPSGKIHRKNTIKNLTV